MEYPEIDYSGKENFEEILDRHATKDTIYFHCNAYNPEGLFGNDLIGDYLV